MCCYYFSIRLFWPATEKCDHSHREDDALAINSCLWQPKKSKVRCRKKASTEKLDRVIVSEWYEDDEREQSSWAKEHEGFKGLFLVCWQHSLVCYHSLIHLDVIVLCENVHNLAPSNKIQSSLKLRSNLAK